jgi:putative DNA primase/helicase
MSEPAIAAALLAENAARYEESPLPEDEVRSIATSVAQYEPAAENQVILLTDLGNARLFAAENSDRLRYVVTARKWIAWDGSRWRKDENGEHVRAAKQPVEGMLRRAVELAGDGRKAALKHAMDSQDEPRIRRMLTLAGTELELALTAGQLDADPWLLSCANGTLDLRTGEFRANDPADLISLGTDIRYDAEARCRRWERFLLEVFGGDRDVVRFVQRAIGYSLTGATIEHILFILWGAGCNGKTTFIEIVKRLLGSLAATAAFDTFTRVRGDRGPRNDLARLHRARLVSASESGEGRQLDEATVKTLTGGDTVTARFLYGEHFEFRPEFKLWLATNHRPRVDGGDDAIWRRIRLIPFEVSFRGREDRELGPALEAELPGILAWAVRSCLAWQREALGTAGAVDRATATYREEEDVLGAFIAERCNVGEELSCEASELRESYEAFSRELGEKPQGASALGRALVKRGFTTERTRLGGRYRGIAPR